MEPTLMDLFTPWLEQTRVEEASQVSAISIVEMVNIAELVQGLNNYLHT